MLYTRILHYSAAPLLELQISHNKYLEFHACVHRLHNNLFYLKQAKEPILCCPFLTSFLKILELLFQILHFFYSLRFLVPLYLNLFLTGIHCQTFEESMP